MSSAGWEVVLPSQGADKYKTRAGNMAQKMKDETLRAACSSASPAGADLVPAL